MSVIRALQLSLLLVGLSRAHPGRPSMSRESGEVPASHLRILSLGLGRLLQGVRDNVGLLEKEGGTVSVQVSRPTQTLERLQKQSTRTGRVHKQVRKDLQVAAAGRDGLWRSVRGLQEEMEELAAEQRAMQRRMIRILRSAKSLTGPRPAGRAEMDMRTIKILVDKQARRLASLTSEVLARDRVINRCLQSIKRLEKQFASSQELHFYRQ